MNNFRQINLPILPLDDQLTDMLKKNLISWGIHNQICINSTPSKTDDIFHGVASLEYDWNNKRKKEDGSLEVPKRDVPLQEKDFTELCNVFRKTYFEDVYNAMKEKFTIGRVRIMRSKPKTCLTWHTDPSTRLHFPIKTQEGCYMVIQDEIKHLTQNEWWMTDTTMPHTAFNGSKESRIHLVAVIL